MKAKIKKIIQETSNVKTFVLELEKEFEHKSGQFVRAKIPEFQFARPFSMSSIGGKTKEISLTMRIYDTGNFTSNIDKKKVNDIVEIEGPYGFLIFDESMKEDVVLLAAGTGISTLHSILTFILKKKLKNKVSVVYTVRNEEDIIFKDELEKYSKEKKIDYHLTVTNSSKNWKGNTSRINKKILKNYDTNSKFYIVGPNEFVKDMLKILEELKVSKENIKFEMYG